uniref:BTB domain-containing protein n=1 Tax=Panagrellus redivivus TaxID=6233 RepID=A0A7E4URC1_PANRE
MAEILKDQVAVNVSGYNSGSSVIRAIPGSEGLKWSFYVYPKGKEGSSSYIDVYIRVEGGGAYVKATFDGYTSYSGSFKKTFEHEFNDGEEHALKGVWSNQYAMQGRNLTITCTATFEPMKTKLDPLMVHELIDKTKSHSSNATIVVDTDEIKIHRGFLSMLSPVFTAMFSPETKESKTGIVNIKDFPVTTVQNAINYCYGVDLGRISAADVVEMLQFYDKYDMQPLMTKLEAWLKANLTVKNFAPIAAYAWKYSRLSFQADCGRMFHKNRNEIMDRPDFVALDPTVIAGVVIAGYTSTRRTIDDDNSGEDDS